MIRKKGQEEMVGFALIMIIVAVILVIFLSFFLNRSNEEFVESYEVESFIQSMLQYTTDCRDNLEYLSIQKLIIDCQDKKICLDERDTCEVLNFTLNKVIDESWKIDEDRPIKGYKLNIVVDEAIVLNIQEGNITKNSKGATQFLSRSGIDYEIFFSAYY